jgi:hypothetical protein
MLLPDRRVVVGGIAHHNLRLTPREVVNPFRKIPKTFPKIGIAGWQGLPHRPRNACCARSVMLGVP